MIPEPPTLVLDPNDENIILGIPEDRSPEKEQEETSTKKEKVSSFSAGQMQFLINPRC